MQGIAQSPPPFIPKWYFKQKANNAALWFIEVTDCDLHI